MAKTVFRRKMTVAVNRVEVTNDSTGVTAHFRRWPTAPDVAEQVLFLDGIWNPVSTPTWRDLTRMHEVSVTLDGGEPLVDTAWLAAFSFVRKIGDWDTYRAEFVTRSSLIQDALMASAAPSATAPSTAVEA